MSHSHALSNPMPPLSRDRGASGDSSRAIAAWLLVCCAMLFAMVVVGGVTRLTHSGLSMVEWQPIVGAIPPLNDAEWQATFAKYQQTPEFKLRNFDMSVNEFKGIFWWEYVHRLWGRLIGLAFALPLLAFWLGGRLPRGLAPRLLLLLALGHHRSRVRPFPPGCARKRVGKDAKPVDTRLLGLHCLLDAAKRHVALHKLRRVDLRRHIGPGRRVGPK